MDLTTAWGWHRIDADALLRLQAWMAGLEGKTWEEACSKSGPGCKPISLDSPSEHARKITRRLEELEKDDIDSLYEFHLDGLTRFWGIRRGHACHLLWWDPEHLIWPSKKKHT